MKLFAKVMIAVLFIALLLPFTILKGKDGNTLMNLTDLRLPDLSGISVDMPDLPGVPASASLQSAEEIQAADDNLEGKDLFYRWTDSEGNIQFTSEPPPDGVEYIVKGYDPNANVIQSVKLPQQENQTEEDDPVVGTDSPEDIGNPYSPETIKKLFEDAKNVEELLNQRLKDQEAQLNQ